MQNRFARQSPQSMTTQADVLEEAERHAKQINVDSIVLCNQLSTLSARKIGCSSRCWQLIEWNVHFIACCEQHRRRWWWYPRTTDKQKRKSNKNDQGKNNNKIDSNFKALPLHFAAGLSSARRLLSYASPRLNPRVLSVRESGIRWALIAFILASQWNRFFRVCPESCSCRRWTLL